MKIESIVGETILYFIYTKAPLKIRIRIRLTVIFGTATTPPEYCKRLCFYRWKSFHLSFIRAINQMKHRLFHYCKTLANTNHLSFFRWRFQKPPIILDAGDSRRRRLNDLKHEKRDRNTRTYTCTYILNSNGLCNINRRLFNECSYKIVLNPCKCGNCESVITNG